MKMRMNNIEVGKKYSLDLGGLTPVDVKTISFTKKGVICEYLNSWSGRVEELDYELFKMNGYNMTQMNSIEENQNALELLKQALMFYANSDNYKQTQPVSNNYELFSMIEMDNGSQARFALEQLEKIQTITQNAEEEFVKEITSAIEDGIETDNVLNLIEQYKEKLENDSNV